MENICLCCKAPLTEVTCCCAAGEAGEYQEGYCIRCCPSHRDQPCHCQDDLGDSESSLGYSEACGVWD